MTRKLFTFFFFIIILCNVYGQDSLAYQSRWQIRIMSGINIPITKMLQGTVTDNLFGYDDHSYYWQILSASYFFHKHWGVEFTYQAGTSNRLRKKSDSYNFITKRSEDFKASMQSEYGDKYYVNGGTGDYDDFSFFSGDIQRGFFGVIYRFETNKFYVYPKLSLGTTSFYTDWGRVDLKEKNTNIKCRIDYSCGTGQYDHFTFAPSVSFGYKISKRFYVNADIMVSYFKNNIECIKKFTNLYTNESSVDYFDYKRNIFTLSLGVGLIYVIH